MLTVCLLSQNLGCFEIDCVLPISTWITVFCFLFWLFFLISTSCGLCSYHTGAGRLQWPILNLNWTCSTCCSICTQLSSLHSRVRSALHTNVLSLPQSVELESMRFICESESCSWLSGFGYKPLIQVTNQKLSPSSRYPSKYPLDPSTTDSNVLLAAQFMNMQFGDNLGPNSVSVLAAMADLINTSYGYHIAHSIVSKCWCAFGFCVSFFHSCF